jgi:hypothetical protein
VRDGAIDRTRHHPEQHCKYRNREASDAEPIPSFQDPVEPPITDMLMVTIDISNVGFT